MTKGNNAAASVAPASARTPAQDAYARQLLLMDIHITWGKLRREELSGLKNRDELVARLVAIYGLEKEAAQRDLDALLQGRTF